MSNLQTDLARRVSLFSAVACGHSFSRPVQRADSVTLARYVVLEALSPSERMDFVLHDLFGVPFDEIGAIVGQLDGNRHPAGHPAATAGARGW